MGRAAFAVLLLCVACQRSPRVEVVPRVCDLGNLVLSDREHEVVGSVVIRNTGSARLSVHVEKQSCSCLRARFRTLQLPAGDSAEVEIAMRVTSAGRKEETLVLRTNDPNMPTIAVQVRLHVYAALTFQPRTISFKATAPRTELDTEVIADRAAYDLSPIKESLIPELDEGVVGMVQFTLERQEAIDGEQGDPPIARTRQHYRLRLSDPPVGKHRTTLRFKPSSPNAEVTALPVVWQLETPVLTRPPSLFWGFVAAGEFVTKSIVVQARDGSPFTVTLPERVPGADQVSFSFEADKPPRARPEHHLRVRASFPPGARGRQQGVLTIRTDHPGMKSVSIPWDVFVQASPDGSERSREGRGAASPPAPEVRVRVPGIP